MHVKSFNAFPASPASAILLLLSFQLSFTIISMEHISRDYNKLNDYLIKHVDDSASYEENIKAASELLEEENKSASFWNKKFRQQLESFISLKELEDDNCDEKSFQIISDNNEFTNDRAGDLGAEFKELRRVDTIVNHYLRNHVNYCWPLYKELYHYHRLNLKDQIKAEYVERFIDNVIEEHRPNKEERKYYFDKDQIYRFMLNIGTIQGKESAIGILKSIREFAHEARIPDAKLLSKHLDERKGITIRASEEKLKEYYKLYIVDSCEYFVNDLKCVLQPMIYDYNLVYKTKRDQVDRDLFAAMSYFKLCQNLLDEKRNSVQSDLISVSKKDDTIADVPNVVRKPIRELIEEDREKHKNTLLDDKNYNSQTFMVNLRHNLNNLNRKRASVQKEDDSVELAKETYENIDYPSDDDDDI